jgi:hypothetical protein
LNFRRYGGAIAIQIEVVAFGWVAENYMWPRSIWPGLRQLVFVHSFSLREISVSSGLDVREREVNGTSDGEGE